MILLRNLSTKFNLSVYKEIDIQYKLVKMVYKKFDKYVIKV